MKRGMPARPGHSRPGLTLIEILIASVILALAMLSLFIINSSSNQMTLDSYFEFLAVQMAQEPLEVFRSVGYPACAALPRYPVGKTEPIPSDSGFYPSEASMFERTITLDTSKAPLCVVTVSVAPKTNSMARIWMRKGKHSIVLRGVVPFVR